MDKIHRRHFLQATSAAFASATLCDQTSAAPDPAKTASPWYETAYRRAVIDMHIPDWDEKFLSEFDTKTYVSMLKKARAQSVVAYAQSHVGLFNYPTKVGQQHRGLKGRDILKEITEQCRSAGIAVAVYVSLIFDRWAADNHPDWRMIMPNGEPYGKGGRHGLSCPNSPYREYVRSWVKELCTHYDFEGLRFDMTFWPGVCYCKHCQKRFADEVDGELPRTIDWLNERWVTFQRKREQWLGEFAELATSTVRKYKPKASVEHQASTLPQSWSLGAAEPLVAQNDFLQGDFYGDSWQGSFVRKLLDDLSPHRPFGFETSFSLQLQDHTAMKSEALLEGKASAALADGAAFIFIDAIDPIGTLNPLVYERMGVIFDRLMPFYKHVGGKRVCDVAVYYSLASKFDFAANGKSVGAGDTSGDAHTASAMAVVRRLIAHHVPFGIITKKSLVNLSDHQVLVLPNVCQMDEDETRPIREWVRSGGCLLATGWTSLVNKSGQLQKDFMLGDVLGVSLKKTSWQGWEHYIAPTPAGKSYFDHFSAKYPAFVRSIGVQIEARPEAEILATTTLPWLTNDPTKFSSIHSNPPWEATNRPEIVVNKFGRGRAIYCSSPIETVEVLEATFVLLIRLLHNKSSFEVDAPACVEATLFHQPDRNRYLFNLVNFQKDMPNLPVEGIAVRLRLPKGQVKAINRLPDVVSLPFQVVDDVVSFKLPRLQTLLMVEVLTA
jgi:hypothetical protein